MSAITIDKNNYIHRYVPVLKKETKTKIRASNFIPREIGLLPPGVRYINHIYGREWFSSYTYIMIESPPQRRNISFKNMMKLEALDSPSTDDNIYSLPFPWMQFHISIPIFSTNMENRERRTIDIAISLTKQPFQNFDQKVLPFHLPNTIWPGNQVCIYGPALGFGSDHWDHYISEKNIENMTIGHLSNLAIGAVIGSGWNMNVGSWPEILPKEMGVKEHYMQDNWGDKILKADQMNTIKAWENLSVKDVLRFKEDKISIRNSIFNYKLVDKKEYTIEDISSVLGT